MIAGGWISWKEKRKKMGRGVEWSGVERRAYRSNDEGTTNVDAHTKVVVLTRSTVRPLLTRYPLTQFYL